MLDREMVLLGRFRKVRHALVFRHLSSPDSFMVVRYFSRLLRRSSVSSGEVVVLVNHDFEGRVAGGTAPTWEVRRLWRMVKSV